jgi:hypothetical protein
MELMGFQNVFGYVVDPVIDFYLAAGKVTADFAWERDTMLRVTARADISSVAALWIAAEQKTKEDFVCISARFERNFFLHPFIAPEIPMNAKDLAEPGAAGGASDTLVRGALNCICNRQGRPLLGWPIINAGMVVEIAPYLKRG